MDGGLRAVYEGDLDAEAEKFCPYRPACVTQLLSGHLPSSIYSSER